MKWGEMLLKKSIVIKLWVVENTAFVCMTFHNFQVMLEYVLMIFSMDATSFGT